MDFGLSKVCHRSPSHAKHTRSFKCLPSHHTIHPMCRIRLLEASSRWCPASELRYHQACRHQHLLREINALATANKGLLLEDRTNMRFPDSTYFAAPLCIQQYMARLEILKCHYICHSRS